MKSEIVQGRLHVQGCEAPVTAGSQGALCLDVAAPALVSAFDIDRFGNSRFQCSIQGKASLSGDRIAIAGYPETAAAAAGFALKPATESEECRKWTATVAYLGDGAATDGEESYLIEAFVPQPAFARIETALGSSGIDFLRLCLDADGLWAEALDVGAEQGGDVVWRLRPASKEQPGVEDLPAMAIRTLSWETRKRDRP